MFNYRSLKGTGKALEKVPAMRSVKGSSKFVEAVKKSAAAELSALVEKLPPDKRLRLEVRRAARQSNIIMPRPVPNRRILTWGLSAGVLIGLAALAAIIFYPRSGDLPIDTHLPMGTLILTVGNVEQFYQRASEPHTPVKDGKSISPGDTYFTRENGRARFVVNDGGTVFLGPSSQMTFRAPSQKSTDLVYVLESGEMGLERPSIDDESEATLKSPRWEIRTEAGHIILSPGSHAYLRVSKTDKEYSGEMTLLYGFAEFTQRNGQKAADLEAGQKISFYSGMKMPVVDTLQVTEVPQWRVDLVSERDLTRLLNHPVKLHNRHDGIEIEILYGRENKLAGFNDWISDSGGSQIAESGEGVITLPAHSKLRHMVPFSAPLAIEVLLNHDSVRDTSFAFGALQTPESGIAVDTARDAVMQILEKGKATRRASVTARIQPGKPEKLGLEVKRDKAVYSAVLNSSSCNSSLPLDGHKKGSTGDLWLQALGDGLLIDEIKVCGVVPSEWLRERLSKIVISN